MPIKSRRSFGEEDIGKEKEILYSLREAEKRGIKRLKLVL